jgi:hypothetical protein
LLIKIDEQNAIKRQTVAGQGPARADDLVMRHGGLNLRPAYYPFWTFDGTLEIPWSCQVNEGSNDHPRWVPRSGTEYEFFDDVLVPGLRSMSEAELARIEPFNLKDLVEFSPAYVAGWGALAYDYPLADASLRARGRVLQRVTLFLFTKVEAGRQKRDFRTGAGGWSGLTFKHVLLPLWVGTYQYQGKPYRLIVNGQTGKVGGIKPRDNLKLGIVLIIAVVVLAMLSALLYPLLTRLLGG